MKHWRKKFIETNVEKYEESQVAILNRKMFVNPLGYWPQKPRWHWFDTSCILQLQKQLKHQHFTYPSIINVCYPTKGYGNFLLYSTTESLILSFWKDILKTCSESAEFGSNSLQKLQPTEVSRPIWRSHIFRLSIISSHLNSALMHVIFNLY